MYFKARDLRIIVCVISTPLSLTFLAPPLAANVDHTDSVLEIVKQTKTTFQVLKKDDNHIHRSQALAPRTPFRTKKREKREGQKESKTPALSRRTLLKIGAAGVVAATGFGVWWATTPEADQDLWVQQGTLPPTERQTSHAMTETQRQTLAWVKTNIIREFETYYSEIAHMSKPTSQAIAAAFDLHARTVVTSTISSLANEPEFKGVDPKKFTSLVIGRDMKPVLPQLENIFEERLPAYFRRHNILFAIQKEDRIHRGREIAAKEVLFYELSDAPQPVPHGLEPLEMAPRHAAITNTLLSDYRTWLKTANQSSIEEMSFAVGDVIYYDVPRMRALAKELWGKRHILKKYYEWAIQSDHGRLTKGHYPELIYHNLAKALSYIDIEEYAPRGTSEDTYIVGRVQRQMEDSMNYHLSYMLDRQIFEKIKMPEDLREEIFEIHAQLAGLAFSPLKYAVLETIFRRATSLSTPHHLSSRFIIDRLVYQLSGQIDGEPTGHFETFMSTLKPLPPDANEAEGALNRLIETVRIPEPALAEFGDLYYYEIFSKKDKLPELMGPLLRTEGLPSTGTSTPAEEIPLVGQWIVPMAASKPPAQIVLPDPSPVQGSL